MKTLIAEAVNMLLDESAYEKKIYGYEFEKLQTILEDANSPVSVKYKEKLYESVLAKSHIDFGDIPKSKGDIRAYSGYSSMMDCLDIFLNIGTESVIKYANTILEAIKNIESLSMVYKKGFDANNDYVMLEYNTYTYTCVQAVTSILYEFVDYVKRPDKPTYVIQLQDTKSRANYFYLEQLEKFNNVNKRMHANYVKMLETMIDQGKNNFTGIEAVGLAAVSIVALAIVPVTRELIYRFYNLRANLADELALQANFLEMNKSCVEANSSFTEEKRRKILAKQESLRKTMLSLSEKIKVKDVKAMKVSEKEMKKDNQLLSVNGLRDEVSNSPFVIV